MILWSWLQNIETITKIAKSIWNHESHYRYPMMVSELLKWTTFVPSSLFVQAMTSLLLHKNFYFVHFGVTPNSPKPWTSFLDDPLPENYWKISQYIVIELIWILCNWYENIGNKIVIAKLIWKYWILYWYCKIYRAILK